MLVAAFVSLLIAAPASAYVLGPYPGNPITIPNSGSGSPYPSTLSLGSVIGKLDSMTAQVNVSHEFAGDIDLLLVSPQGVGVMLMSDTCGSQTISSMSFTFSDSAASMLPETATCTSGTYKPTDYVSSTQDTFPSPAPSSYSPTLSAYKGIDPTGNWSLFVVDDAAGDTGAINSWSLTFDVSPAEIKVPEFGTSGKAEPYPSTRTVNTPPGRVISDLKLNIQGFGHSSPGDVDMLLADDKGNAAVVMSDSCGSDPFYGRNWTFGDPFVDALGESGPCPDGNYQTTDYLTAPDDQWPAPAPAPQFGNFSDVFGGLEGGVWSLYVVDDSEGNYGYINGWNLELETRPATPVGFSSPTATVAEGRRGFVFLGRDGPTPYGPGEVTLGARSGSARADSDFRFRGSTLEFGRDYLGTRIGLDPIDDGIAEKAEKFQLVLSNPQGDAALSDATSSITVSIPASKNATLKLGRLGLNRKKGTGTLTARVSSPGRVSVSGKGLVRSTKKLTSAGKVVLPLKATGKAKRTLRKTGQVTMKAKVTYRTLGGRKVTRTRSFSLKSGGHH
ncbi:MAG: hypothetical protein KDB54_06370 [Solirubrobacterales bacterium]|nr:hypothetical protein [Solirubrobacterales bacterium]